ncbi:MAG TPA: hypothetical protein VJ201_02950 [Candidatus Babeliales bacterium]|nr:hypothetical protein [Candidatus Babeliales bacterium]
MNSKKYNFLINFSFIFFIIPTIFTSFSINSFHSESFAKKTAIPNSQKKDGEKNTTEEVPSVHVFSLGDLLWTLGVSIGAYSAYSQEPNPDNKKKECLFVVGKEGTTKLIFESGKYYIKKYSGHEEIIECPKENVKGRNTCVLAQKMINTIANHIVYIAIQAYIVNPATNEFRRQIQI